MRCRVNDLQNINTFSIQLNVSEQGLSLVLKPTFNPYQPLLEIDMDDNIYIQGHKIGKLDEEGTVIFLKRSQ